MEDIGPSRLFGFTLVLMMMSISYCAVAQQTGDNASMRTVEKAPASQKEDSKPRTTGEQVGTEQPNANASAPAAQVEVAPPNPEKSADAAATEAESQKVASPQKTPTETRQGNSDNVDAPSAPLPAAGGQMTAEARAEEPSRQPEAVPVQPIPIVTVRPSRERAAAESGAASDEGALLRGEWTKRVLFSTEDGSFRFQPRGWIQPRFGLSIKSDMLPGEDDRFDGTGFLLQRGRFGFQAWLYDFGHFYLDTGWKSGTPTLIDYFVDVGPQNGGGAVAVRLGFFRPYFSRQLLHSTTQLAMIDYAKAWSDSSLALGLGPSGRQLGVALQGFAFGWLGYGVGIWNGSDGYDADAD